MNKYDFGYELEENSTNKWAFEKVNKESKVLEIGASNGRLTKHLKEELNCIVDIVEIDEESGVVAKKYARRAFLGKEEGDIEASGCIQLLGEETYDYIVFLDVLEHLINPQKVLQQLKSHLNETGSILISVPNIAHNSIIINLMQNKFKYTELGILDNTHLHFFTNASFREMVEKEGYYIADNSAVQKLVGDTEIRNSYKEIPREVAAYLRTREQADVYQILFELKRTKTAEVGFSTTNLNYTLYNSQIYLGDGKLLKRDYFVNPKDIHFSIRLNGEKENNKIRIDPLNANCIIRNLQITGKRFSGDSVELQRITMNGFEYQPGYIVFVSNDPQIYISCMPDIEVVSFSCQCIAYDTDVLDCFEDIIKENLNLKSELFDEKNHNIEYKTEYDKLLDMYKTTEAVKGSIEDQYRNLEMQYQHLEKRYRKLKEEHTASNA